jgi:gamma-glutamyl-gamma-aminobutyraldehyde dehydrogenase/4-guanidinobutyraldehyde dehydrogenase/NAD-dependent aldehyde dehydrogenase
LIDWKQRVSLLSFPKQAFIAGKFQDSASGQTSDVISPIDGSVITQVSECAVDDVDRAVAQARDVFEAGTWSRSAPKERKAVLARFGDMLEENASDLALLIGADMGKPVGDAEFEVGLAAAQFRYFGEAADKVYGQVVPTAQTAYATVTREPVGVVAAVVPWNYPVLMPTWKLAPALAAGNSVVLKPAEQSPLAALRLAELAAEAGVPPGVLSVLPGAGNVVGRALGMHMEVDKLAFTGSTEVGKLFLRYSSESNMKSVQLECGGKSPSLVLADAPDLSLVTAFTAEGIFGNAGQVCNANSRLIVHESRADELLENLRRAAETWQPGNPFDPSSKMGPLVDAAQLSRVSAYVELAASEGATVDTGGAQVLKDTGGWYFEPTIFTDVSPEMRVAQEEIFGPVLAVQTFHSEEEAVRIANGTPYGLAAGVWTRDLTTAHRLARALRAGSVYVNCYDLGDVSLPVGGYKQSGFGRDKSLHALDNYTQLKGTFINLVD